MSPGRVAWPLGRFSQRRHDREDAHRQAELGDRSDGGEDGPAASHVRLHVVHVVGGLQREAAGVERDRLADEADPEVGPGWLRRLVGQGDQPRLVVAPLADGGEGAHAGRPDLLGPQRLEAEVLAPAGDLLGPRSQTLGRQLVGGRVDHVAAAVRPGRGDVRAPGSVCGAARGRAAEHEPLDAAAPLVLRLPAPVVVRAEHGPVDDRPALLLGGEAVLLDHPGDRRPADVEGARRHPGCRRAEPVGVQRAAAEPYGAHPRGGQPAVGVQEGDVALLSSELARLE